MLKNFKNKKPEIHENVYIAESSEIIGDVLIGRKSSVWPKAVIRGDVASITIGKCSNIQDNSVIHCKNNVPTIIKDYVTVGHNCIVHSATVEDNCIIGMGAILLNNCEIGKNSVIGAGAVVKENEKIPPNSLAVGIPAKVVRTLSREDSKKIRENAEEYLKLSKEYMKI